MTTLRIEHAIHDYDQWKAAFDSFAAARAKGGVRSFAVRLPADDEKYLMLDLEFDTASRAEAFAKFHCFVPCALCSAEKIGRH